VRTRISSSQNEPAFNIWAVRDLISNFNNNETLKQKASVYGLFSQSYGCMLPVTLNVNYSSLLLLIIKILLGAWYIW